MAAPTDSDDPALVSRLLAAGAAVTIRVASGSMRPTLERGDAVIVRAGSPALGDVVLVRGARHLVLHRLVATVRLPGLGRRWVHKGDAARSLPGLCREDQILGVADLPRRPPRRFLRGAAILRVLLRRMLGALGPISDKRDYFNSGPVGAGRWR